MSAQRVRGLQLVSVLALLSAWGETFGVAVAEAMHFGLPLVLSDKVGSGPDKVSSTARSQTRTMR